MTINISSKATLQTLYSVVIYPNNLNLNLILDIELNNQKKKKISK